MLLELSRAQGVVLFENLQKQDRVASYPIRGMLWSILRGQIKSGKIYADVWPKPQAVACVESIREYCDYDWDATTLFGEKAPDQMASFVTELRKERGWNPSKGFLFLDIGDALYHQLANVFSDGGPLERYGPYQAWAHHYSQGNAVLTKQSREPQIPPLPPGFTLDSLKEEEAEYICQFWHYDLFPDKVAYFRWLISEFPQVCLRDSKGKPISWCLQYEWGTDGARYTIEAYRNQGLYRWVFPAMTRLHYARSPVKENVEIEYGNTVSEHLAGKYRGAEPTNYNWNCVRREPIQAAETKAHL